MVLYCDRVELIQFIISSAQLKVYHYILITEECKIKIYISYQINKYAQLCTCKKQIHHLYSSKMEIQRKSNKDA